MAGETTITIVGNLTADPELRFTPSGAAVANFTVASTPRTFDRQSNEWKDGETLFMRCSIWRPPGVAIWMPRIPRPGTIGQSGPRSEREIPSLVPPTAPPSAGGARCR